jgi:hypothetical protein
LIRSADADAAGAEGAAMGKDKARTRVVVRDKVRDVGAGAVRAKGNAKNEVRAKGVVTVNIPIRDSNREASRDNLTVRPSGQTIRLRGLTSRRRFTGNQQRRRMFTPRRPRCR